MPDIIETPKRYSEFLERIGGTNLYGEPCFILQWSASPIRRCAVPDDFLAPYMHCWCLAEWTPAEDFGSPSQLAALEIRFPERGAYLPIQTYKTIDSEELNLNILEMTVWVVMNHKTDTLRKRYDFMKDEYARVEAEKKQRLVDRIEEGAPAFLDAVSFTGQLNCNSVVKQKMDQLEKNLDRITNAAARFSRGGLTQRSV